MSAGLRRRKFLLYGAAATVALSAVARAQQPVMPVIGFLSAGGAPDRPALAAFNKGLNEIGFAEGRNVAVMLRASEQYDRLPALAADMAKLPVAVIYAAGSVNAARAAKVATTNIPIVFVNGSDPVRVGLVASVNRPGGNVTGVTFFSSTLNAKRLELLRELIPQARLIALLVNPANERAEEDISDLKQLAGGIGQEIMIVRAGTAANIEEGFVAMAKRGVDGLLVAGDAAFTRRPEPIVSFATRHRIPTSFPSRPGPEAGALFSYGDDRAESYRQAGRYVGRILKGENPAEMPVLQPSKFEFVINLKAAKALGITFPPSFHLRADDVIE